MKVDRNSKPSIAARLVELGKAKRPRDLLKMDRSCSRKALLRLLDQAEAEAAALALIPMAIPYAIPYATIAPPLDQPAAAPIKPARPRRRKSLARAIAHQVLLVLGPAPTLRFVV